MSFDPFAAWTRMASAGLNMLETAQRVGETMVAANTVIGKRSKLMDDAYKAPLQADVAELGRMVPEKVEAFSRSGAAVATEWWAMQTAALAEAQRLGALAMRGKPVTASELASSGARTMNHALKMMEHGAALASGAVKPVHARATANARRLSRRKKPR